MHVHESSSGQPTDVAALITLNVISSILAWWVHDDHAQHVVNALAAIGWCVSIAYGSWRIYDRWRSRK